MNKIDYVMAIMGLLLMLSGLVWWHFDHSVSPVAEHIEIQPSTMIPLPATKSSLLPAGIPTNIEKSAITQPPDHISPSGNSEVTINNPSQSTAITPSEYQARLGIGMDVDWAKTATGRQAYSSPDPQNFKKQGFSHVRIRVKEAVSDSLLKHIHQVVDDSLKAGLMPILAYQANDFKKNPDEKNMQKAIDWWRTVSKSFKDYPPELSFDLIIEVTDTLNKKPTVLNEFYERAVSEIRHTNPDRNIFISPVVRSSPENLPLLKIPSRANGHLLAEWHMYASGPSKINQKKKWTTGTKEEKELIRAKIRTAQDWSQRTGIRTWVGAWMPSNYNKGDDYTISEQVQFASFVAHELKRAKIPFAINSDAKFYDRTSHTWLPNIKPVLDAILKAD